MKVTASPRLTGYAAIGGFSLLVGIVLQRPEPAVIGAAFLTVAVVAAGRRKPPAIEVRATLDLAQIVEGDAVTVDVDLHVTNPAPWLQIFVMPAPGLEPQGRVGVRTLAVEAGGRRTLSMPLVARRWGNFRLGTVFVAARDAAGLFTFESRVQDDLRLRVFPREERIVRAMRPLETQTLSGDEVARVKGDGIEFADVRRFEPGDRVRRINWAVSTRLGRLHVNELHPERNTDVVIFMDAFSEVGDGHESTLLSAVRATASVARHYLNRRNRVGLVAFGGTLRWQFPAMGTQQLYRILDALLNTESMLSYAWKGIDVIPTRTLPAKALIVAITPLEDDRTLRALFDLRGRGFDLVVVEVSPEMFVAPPRDEAEALARRLWRLQREVLRHEYWQAGIPVATWSPDRPLSVALEEIGRFRQFAQTSRVS